LLLLFQIQQIMEFKSEKEALEYCFDRINLSYLDIDEYNKLRQYKSRFYRGKLGEKAKKTLFNRFNIQKQCHYSISKELKPIKK